MEQNTGGTSDGPVCERAVPEKQAAFGEEEPWYLVSDLPGQTELLHIYRRCMWVEETYGDLKGHGFDLEATHPNDSDRIARLVLVFCILFVRLITRGRWVVKRADRHLADHKSHREKSYFRTGWDWTERRLRKR